jgi:antitoxin HicB
MEAYMNKSNIGSRFDDFLSEVGIYEEVVDLAFKKVIAFQIQQEMEKKHIKKIEMAEKMETSRSTLDRLLDPENAAINLSTIQKAASVLGKRVEIKLV